ncbi:hypothetical protein F4860DRAFT_508085 [Xylaria cubensis]|nr:hypothetical protein F4860DRAFT_508085 [Xylaria cubensis]
MTLSDLRKRESAAVRDVKLGLSIRAAATKWNTSRSGVTRRLQGIPTRNQLNRDFQALSPYLESKLACWAIGQARLGYAPTLVKMDAPKATHVPPDRHYNTNEIGLGQSVGSDHWVVAETKSRQAFKKDVERSEWITALEVPVSRTSSILAKTLVYGRSSALNVRPMGGRVTQ